MKMMSCPRIAIAASVLAGCSLLYNPGNLPGAGTGTGSDPTGDASEPDSPPIDVAALKLEAASPAMLFEGQGDGGSRQAVVVVSGENIGSDATVALVPPNGVSPPPMIQVDNAHAARAPSGHVLAVPVTLPVDTGRATGTVALTVRVTQMTPTGPITLTVSGPTVQYLPELTAPVTDPAVLAPLYSRVKMTQTLSFTASATRAVIRAVSSIEVGGAHADADGQTPGPGGAAGGDATKVGNGAGGGQPGNLVDLQNLGLLIAGGGAGYRIAGGAGKNVTGGDAAAGGRATGDDLISSYSTNQGSGGGGGGGSPGGGGGGTIELSAGGTLKVGAVSANGGKGGAGSLLAGAAGGGSGGTILLRSGGPATLASVTASAGAQGGDAAGNGSEGRVRYDVPSITGTVPGGGVRRGAMFASSVPIATSESQPAITLISAAGSDAFKLLVVESAGATTLSSTVVFDTPMVVVKPHLNPGYNRVCVTTPLGGLSSPESANCIEIGYAR